jgi:hypothetical protein
MEASTFADIRGTAAPRTIRPIAIEIIWADKVGLYLAALGLAVIGYIWTLAAIAAGMKGANYLMQHEIRPAVLGDVALAGSIWLFFRATDWAIGGPRRRARRTGR